ncbi:MAG: glycosyltransferase [Vulcanibacillus sp.]
MSNPKKVLILSESFGSGHTNSAQAIKKGINLYRPDWDVQILELGAYIRPTINLIFQEVYIKTLKFTPKLWGYIYSKGKYRETKLSYQFILQKIIYTQILSILNLYNPNLIITTHPFPSIVLSRLKKNGVNRPLHTVLTDYSAHGIWVSSGIDYYYAPSIEVKYQLMRIGVNENKIFIGGIPTHPNFWNKNNKLIVRKKLNVKDTTTILIMGGGLGLGISTEYISKIEKDFKNVQLLIVTGHNKNLYNILKENYGNKKNIIVYDYVNNIDELMDASDLLITKPGGITITEALNKELPMILLNPIPGQEEDNKDYVIMNKYGIYANSYKEIYDTLISITNNKNRFFNEFKYRNSNFSRVTIKQIIANSN